MSTPPSSQKKGMSGLAIAGIGCLGILVIAFLGGGFVIAKLFPKIKEFAADPAKAAVWALEMSPDIEVLKKDEAKREITFKTKSTGEVTTLSFDDLEKGKISLKNDKGEYMVDASKAQTEGMVLKTPEGQTTLKAGAAAASSLPAQVPVYPGLQLKEDAGYRMEQPNGVNGMATGTVSGDLVAIKDHYEAKLKASGYEVTSLINGNNESAAINAKKGEGQDHISIVIAPEEGAPGTLQVTTQYYLPKP